MLWWPLICAPTGANRTMLCLSILFAHSSAQLP